MTYYLNFLREVKKTDDKVEYDSTKLDEEPTQITIPKVIEIVKKFRESKGFQECGLVESKSQPTKTKTEKNSSRSKKSSKPKIDKPSVSLQGLSGKVYICKVNQIDEEALNQLKKDIVEYIKSCSSNISKSPEELFEAEIGLYFSGLKEVINLRTYLNEYLKGQKAYKTGYLWIMDG